MISSTLLALNWERNSKEVSEAEIYLICEVQDNVKLDTLNKINSCLFQKNAGRILLIYNRQTEIAFAVTLKGFTKDYKLIKSLLWEYGILLSTKIIMGKPELKVLKDYGETDN